jgi:hypothetical protein
MVGVFSVEASEWREAESLHDDNRWPARMQRSRRDARLAPSTSMSPLRCSTPPELNQLQQDPSTATHCYEPGQGLDHFTSTGRSLPARSLPGPPSGRGYSTTSSTTRGVVASRSESITISKRTRGSCAIYYRMEIRSTILTPACCTLGSQEIGGAPALAVREVELPAILTVVNLLRRAPPRRRSDSQHRPSPTLASRSRKRPPSGSGSAYHRWWWLGCWRSCRARHE